ncbi:hypothetical protein COB28_04650 [Candidatus Dependentiae bacterium]|nr:MAG: hypothetical protein COB28_04650 [Candidatus Dependentiae bacterium]
MFKATPFLTIANILTLFRIVVTPFLMYAVYSGNYYNAFILMIMGGLSDLFDGVAARYFQDASDLGELFDPIADKVFLSGLCIALVVTPYPLFLIPTWFVMLVVVRDLCLLWAGFFILKNGFRVSLAPSFWGKVSTALLMSGISLLCFQYITSWHVIQFGTPFWIMCAFCNVGSGLHYFIRGFLMLLKRA